MAAAFSPFANPAEALTVQAASRGKETALRFPLSGDALTFGDWRSRALALAHGLLDAGMEPGDHIALLAENRIDWPVVQVAVAMMGGVFVPLNTHYQRDDLAYAMKQSECRGIVLSWGFRNNRYLDMVQALRPDLPKLSLIVVLDDKGEGCVTYDELLSRGRDRPGILPAVPEDAIGSLQYTSGTTGFPKGALLEHRGMMANAWSTAQRLAVGPEDRWTSIIPLFHCAGCIMNILGCLQAGATYVGVPAFDPVDMFRVIEDSQCTLLSGVPTSYLAMLDHPERGSFDLSSLRAGTCGGANADAEVLRRCAEGFPMKGLCQVYGQTEICTLISCPTPTDPARFDTAGVPLDGLTVRVTDPQSGRILSAGEVGQIEARGPMVMRSYFRQPEETAAAIDAEGWLRTGDLGYMNPDGKLVIAGGRLRDMIIRGGENIYPAEIESLLRTHPAVGEVAVFGVEDAYYGERVAAAVQPSAIVESNMLSAYCEGRIAGFKIPDRYFRVTDFPLTASGKIRKTELGRMARDGELEPLA